MPDPQAPIVATTSAIVFDLKQLKQYADMHPQVTVLADTGDMQCALLTFRAEQQMQGVIATSQSLIQCLRGQASLQVGSAQQTLSSGIVVLIEAQTAYDVRARTDCVILVTLTPSPSAAAHELWNSATTLVRRAGD